MKKYARQAGFSAVELLITLFVAAGFLLAAYQLYNIVIKDGGAAHQQAVASNIAYDYLRQYEATAPNPCSASTPVDTTESAEGVGEMQITVNYTCPVASDLSVTKVEVEVTYGDSSSVSYATFARPGPIDIDGLIAWWPMNNSHLSAVGSINSTATALTSAQGQNGTANGSYQFNGTSSLISTNHTEVPFPIAKITLSAWFKTSNVTTPPMQKMLSNTQSGGLQLSLNEGGCPNQLGLLIHVDGAYKRLCTSLSGSLNNTWIFVAGTYDGSTVRLYVNGEPISSMAASGNITYAPSLSPLCIGAEPNDSTCTQEYFNGYIDDVRIYSRALSAAEISQLFNDGAK